jgi:peptidoglycan hydrolase-like protein with peptidoglycan-binding domain
MDVDHKTGFSLIKLGSRGDMVMEIQKMLMEAGYELPKYGVDGIYGNETRSAVMRFQEDKGLNPDGIVGPDTYNELLKTKDKTDNVLAKMNDSDGFLLKLFTTGLTYKVKRDGDVYILNPLNNGNVAYNLIKDGNDFFISTEDGNRIKLTDQRDIDFIKKLYEARNLA